MIQKISVVGHPTKERFEQLLNDAVLHFQNLNFDVEIDYAGKSSGYYSALVIARLSS